MTNLEVCASAVLLFPSSNTLFSHLGTCYSANWYRRVAVCDLGRDGTQSVFSSHSLPPVSSSTLMGTSMPTNYHFRCGRSALVDRQEHEESRILICPLPNCNYSWCKACQQPITTANDPPHSCDGTAELDYLMRQQGWKYCPSVC